MSQSKVNRTLTECDINGPIEGALEQAMDSIDKAAEMLFGEEGVGAVNVRFAIMPDVKVSEQGLASQVVNVLEEFKAGKCELVK